MQTYFVDANILIYINKHYPNDINVFQPIWNNLDKLIDNNQFFMPELIFQEVQNKDDFLEEWLKIRKHNICLKINDEVQDEVNNLMTNYPNLIKIELIGASGSSQNDPWLIAHAKISKNNAVILTDEKFKHSKINIPYICQQEKINCIRLHEFMKSNNW